jgi:predicted DNA-binding protein
MPVPVSVHLPPELLERVRKAAQAYDRTLSEWVRQAVEHELRGS